MASPGRSVSPTLPTVKPTPRRAPRASKCPHLASKTKAISDRLKVLVPYANVCRHRQALLQGRRGASNTEREQTPADGDRSRKRLVEEMPAPVCFDCSTPSDRLHACLFCDYFGCWRQGQHIVSHLSATGHSFAIDFVHLQLFCIECNDYVCDPGVFGTLLAAQVRWHAALCDSAEPDAKRPRIVSAGTDLSPVQTKYLKEHGTVGGCAGVRGLFNLGATCYLSVVLQALVHNPLVRGWMLSDGHHPSKCRVGVWASGKDACMACELEASFQAFYSGDPSPFGPVRLLRALWLLRSDLAGYGQQDAHECLMAMLDTLHTGFAENALTKPAEVHHTHLAPCPCLVHQTFAGVLQSTVTCSRCGNTTHAHDPILDISLDIPQASAKPESISTSYKMTPTHSFQARALDAAIAARTRTSMTASQHPVVTLQDCLEHYTRAEQLLPLDAYVCSRCNDTTMATKQLCMKELPPVLTFQLKRFEHNKKPGTAQQKIDTFVRFPLNIDMTPYTASALASHGQAITGLRASMGNATTNTGSQLPKKISNVTIHDYLEDAQSVSKDTPIPIIDGPGGSTALGKRRTDATHSNPACQYSLFAVIDHVGQLDTGHYTAFAKHRGQWYMFDDAKVTRVAVADVLGFAEEKKVQAGRSHSAKGKAYMAFYVKSVLDYHDGAATTVVASGNVLAAGMGASNTRVNESGEWIEDAGVVRTRINPNGDVKVERRGRKKGSTNGARKEKDERITPLVESSDSDGEALWARIITKEKSDDLVPMQHEQPGHLDSPSQMFVNDDYDSDFNPA
ncbi:hypothetical protein GGI25_005661 [Coemansia spiralis]|uniref:Ubiquitin carboxyl-terminal hydrolase n=2 Tax=Coemansia TaxID=4863 RepID=A0A9W8G2I1_9FUNG|nr:hypothetical protein BX070DRAFT_224640 [Coemansia spiralis]KAJ1987657.1 hypothetical protein EDC05_005702 [Coemansia umbellata]KAJ2618750.1 hypothetical protein GGI26_006380 [Coemansia sp. RSA 1358]KAJ2671012.1 hypothetical protein GGI25_005661 [Coemansia spiralis]